MKNKLLQKMNKRGRFALALNKYLTGICPVLTMTLILLFTMGIGEVWGTDKYYILGAQAVASNGALTKASSHSNLTLKYIKYNGSTYATTTDISFSETAGINGKYESSAASANISNILTSSKWGTGSGSAYAAGIKFAKSTTYTLALGSKTISKISFLCYPEGNKSSVTIGGTAKTTSSKAWTLHEWTGSYTGNVSMVLSSDNGVYGVFILETSGGGGATTHSVSAVTSTGTSTYGTVSAAASTVEEGGTTTITATPASGYRVTNWAVSGTGASISPIGASNATSTTLTMGTADAIVTVTFGAIPTHIISYTNTKDMDNSANPTSYYEGVGVASFTKLRHAEGYDFTGWSPSSISSSAITNQTIEAQWTARAVAEGSASLTYALTFGSGTITTSSITRVNGALYDATDVSVENTSFSDNANKNGCSGKLTTTSAKSATNYVEVTFTIADGYTFTPTEVSVKANAVSTAKTMEVELKDNAATPNSKSVTGALAEGSTSGGATIALDFDESGEVALEGTITAKIFVYGATDAWRLGTSIVISGTIAEAETPGTNVYLKPNGIWNLGSERYAAYYWDTDNTSDNDWVDFESYNSCTPVYKAVIPSGYDGVILCRMNPSDDDNKWDNVYNQTLDLTVPTGNDTLYTISSINGCTDSKSCGSWGTYTAPTYTISFNNGGGTGTMTAISSLACGANQAITANTFERAGYSFANWTANVDVTVGGETVSAGSAIANQATIQNISSNITLTAAWTQEKPTSVSVDGTWRYFPGQTVSLTATPTGGTGSFTDYQWQKYETSEWVDLKDGLDATDGGTFSGVTTNNLQISGCTKSNCGDYRCVVSKAGGSTESSGYGVHVYTLEGNYNGSDWVSNNITLSSGTVGTVELTLEAGRLYKFKIKDNYNNAYFGNAGYMLQSASSWACPNNVSNDIRVFTGGEGTYTFTVDIDHTNYGTPEVVVSVTYPSVTHPVEGYVYFTNPSSWSNVVAYWWKEGDPDVEFAAWASSPWMFSTNICENTYYYMPKLEGYDRVIFYDSANGSNKTGDIEVAAANSGQKHDGSSWGDFSTYTITFAENGGTGTMSDINSICPNASKALTANAFTKTGYTFSCWHADVDVTVGESTITAGGDISDKATLKSISSDIALTAQWTADTYDVTPSLTNITKASGTTGANAATYNTEYSATFTANTGYELPSDVTVTIGEVAQTKGTGYTWTVSEGVGTFTVPAAKVTGDITLSITSAAKTYEITLHDNNGDENSGSATASYNSNTLTGITEPENEGYVIGGYYAEPGCTNLVADADGNLEANVTISEVAWTDEDGNWIKDGTATLYAEWTSYTLTYNAGGGSGSMDNTTGVGTVTLRTNTFTNTGYVFAGWATSQANANAGTIAYQDGATDYSLTADATLYAVWYKVIYEFTAKTVASSTAMAVDDEVDNSTGGTMVVTSTPASYETYGILFGYQSDPKSAGGYSITLDNNMEAGYMFVGKMYMTGSNTNRGIYVANSSDKNKAEWKFTADGNDHIFTYTTEAGDGFVDSKVIKLKRINSVALKSFMVAKFVAPTAPTFTAPASTPEAVEYTAGDAITALSVTATGTPTPALQWYKNSSASTSGATEISGATSSSYTPSNEEESDQYYYCVATNIAGTAQSVYFHVTVKAAPTYYVTYANGGHGEAPDEPEEKVSSIDLPQIEAVTGYRHIAWTADNDVKVGGVTIDAGEELEIGATAFLTDDTKFTAVWTAVYSVSEGSYTNGAITIDPTSAIVGETIEIEAAADAGYKFKAWKIVDGSSVDKTNDLLGADSTLVSAIFEMPAYDVTVNAKFEELDFCYEFALATSGEAPAVGDEVEGTGSGGSMKVYSKGTESTMGYVSNAGLSFTKTGDVVEVALHHKLQEGTVIVLTQYYGGAGTGRGLTIQSSDGTDITNMVWDFTEGGAKKQAYVVKAEDTKLIGTSVFRIARYSNTYLKEVQVGECGDEVKYTVTYDANGGSCATTSATQASYGAELTLPTPTWSGYTFDGWYNSGTLIGAAGASYTPTANIKLYAKWTDNTEGKAFSFIDGNYGDKFKDFKDGNWVTANGSSKSKTYTNAAGVQFVVTNGAWDNKSNAISALAKFVNGTTSMSVVIPTGYTATVKISYGAYNTSNKLTVGDSEKTAISTTLTDGQTNAQVIGAMKEITLTDQTGTLTLGSSTGNIYIGKVSAVTTATYDTKGDGDWSKAANWGGTVPTINTSVVIPENTEITVKTGVTAKAKEIDLGEGAKLTVQAGGALIVANSISKDGSATAAGDIHLGSDAEHGNAALVMGGNDGTNEATVDFYLKAGYDKNAASENAKWVNQYIGTPFNDESYIKNNYYGTQIYAFNPSTGAWITPKLADDAGLVPFKGYNILSKGSAPGTITLSMGGKMNQTADSVAIDLAFNGSSKTENLLANSWTAPIKIKALESDDFGGAEGTIYIFNAGTPEQYSEGKTDGSAGNYSTYTPGTADETDVIASMEAFSIYATKASQTLTLDYNKLVYTPALSGVTIRANKARRKADSNEMETIKLRVEGMNGWSDEVKIYVREDFTEGFENTFDGHKMFGLDEAPQLYAATEDGELAINCVPDVEGTVLGFKAGTVDEEYTMTFEYEEAEALYLLDTYKNIYTRVETGNSYTFHTDDVSPHNRFILTRYRSPQIATDLEPTPDPSLKGRENGFKFVDGQNMYILYRGVLYDATGKRVEERRNQK